MLAYRGAVNFSNSIRPQLSKLPSVEKTSYGGITEISKQKKRLAVENIRKYKQNLPSVQMGTFYRDHLCNVELYMKHNQWRSQYIEAWMNYQKLGFKKFSDNQFLKDMASMFEVDKLPSGQKWPVVRFSIPLKQPVVLKGIQQITKFVQEQYLVREQVESDQALSETVQKYINENVVPHLEYLFWHPKLTIDTIFHIDHHSSNKQKSPFRLASIFHYNTLKTTKNVIINLWKIIVDNKKYTQSRKNIEKGLKQVMTMIQTDGFIGGDKPNHLDFYLFSILNSKIASKDFQKFLRYDIGGKFWQWYFQMRILTKYDPERVTLL